MIKNSKQHLKNTEENYLQHMGVALKISIQLIKAAFQALIHSKIPALFPKSASSKIKKLYLLIENIKKIRAFKKD